MKLSERYKAIEATIVQSDEDHGIIEILMIDRENDNKYVAFSKQFEKGDIYQY